MAAALFVDWTWPLYEASLVTDILDPLQNIGFTGYGYWGDQLCEGAYHPNRYSWDAL